MKVLLLGCVFSAIPVIVTVLQFISLWTDYFMWDFVFTGFSDGDSYDYVIIGGGSAGAVVANRLSKNNKVLLLEAGGSANILTDIPGMAMLMLHQPSVDFKYQSVPQNKSCLGLHKNQALFPRGKGLGGSSLLNYMLYVRGNKHDYNLWSNLTDSDDWTFDNVLPYFKKSQQYRGFYSNDSKYHSRTGNLEVDDVNYAPLLENFLRGGKELGYDTVDFNGAKQEGFGRDQVTQKAGARWSTYKAFIEPILDRTNLHVSQYSVAEKIYFDKYNRAYGVRFKRHGKIRFARASREIIVSAGAVDTPKLLMLSGIGPKAHLRSLKIRVKADLPVGKNLQDHPASLCGPILIDGAKSFIPERDLTLGSYWDYFMNGQGPLSSTSGLQAMAFVESSQVRSRNESWPDLQLYLVGLGMYSMIVDDIATMVGIDSSQIRRFFVPHIGRDALIILTTLVRPKSRGEILLQDSNPESSPLINPRYFDDDRDLHAITEGLMMCSKLVKETEAFRELNATFLPGRPEGCEIYEEQSREAFECFARRYTSSLYHPAGTARMGKKNDPRSVVDPELRVLKVKGLRVIDASIMPVIVNANTNAPTIMIGEKGADFIRRYWSKQFEVCTLEAYLKYNDKKCYYSRLV